MSHVGHVCFVDIVWLLWVWHLKDAEFHVAIAAHVICACASVTCKHSPPNRHGASHLAKCSFSTMWFDFEYSTSWWISKLALALGPLPPILEQLFVPLLISMASILAKVCVSFEGEWTTRSVCVRRQRSMWVRIYWVHAYLSVVSVSQSADYARLVLTYVDHVTAHLRVPVCHNCASA